MERYSVAGDGGYEIPATKNRRWSAFTGSVILHLLVGAVLVIWPELDNAGLLRSHENNLEREIRKDKATMIYYPRMRRLPDVSPSAARRVTQEAKSIPDEQMIRTQARRRNVNEDQFIRVPVPQIRQQPALPSPNVVVIQQQAAPPPPPPPPPQPRTFTPPTQAKRAPSRTIESLTQSQPDLALLPPPGASAPNIPTNRTLVAPPPPVPGSGKKPSTIQAADAAPQLTATGTGAMGNSPSPTTIIISAAPVPDAPPPKPEGNRNARIAVGGESGTGNNRASAPAGGVTAPGVVIRSTAPPTPGTIPGGKLPDGPPKPAATSAAEAAPRIAPPNITQSVSLPQRPNARSLPPQVEEVFRGRIVYTTVVQTVPGQQDWVMWFADPTEVAAAAAPGSRVVMRPPVPEKGTLPTTIPALPAKGWIKAKLRRNGTLADVQFLGTAGPQSIAELGKWMFYPAIRNGQPSDVDVVMEVTWRQ